MTVIADNVSTWKIVELLIGVNRGDKGSGVIMTLTRDNQRNN